MQVHLKVTQVLNRSISINPILDNGIHQWHILNLALNNVLFLQVGQSHCGILTRRAVSSDSQAWWGRG